MQSDISMGNFSKELSGIEDVGPSSQSGTLREKIVYTKKVYEIDSVTPYKIWGHQFLTEMIFMSCKETLKALLLA